MSDNFSSISSSKPPVVFFGTPEIAAYILEELIECKFNIAAVVTAPDKPAGRGRQLKESEVKKVAIKHKLRVFQPENLNDESFITHLKTISPHVQVVVAFRMLPKEVWQIPALRTFNMHASLLPDYRGAAPINWVIINGEKYTGVTTFLIDEKIDTGSILLQERIEIAPNETAGSLHEKIKIKGSDIVVETLERLLEHIIKPLSQDTLEKNYNYLNKAPKINKEDCRIDWNKSCTEIVNLIRGLNPALGAYTEIPIIDDKPLYIKIYDALPDKFNHDYSIMSIISDNKNFLKITTEDGAVEIKELQMSGKKRIGIKEFLKGYKINTSK